jgi:hypothetical protein
LLRASVDALVVMMMMMMLKSRSVDGVGGKDVWCVESGKWFEMDKILDFISVLRMF